MVWWSIGFLVCSMVGWIVVGFVALRDTADASEVEARAEGRRAELQAAVATERGDAGDVVVALRPAWKLFIRSSAGIGLLAYTEDVATVPVEKMAARLTVSLRPFLLEPLLTARDVPEDLDGPLSSRRPLVVDNHPFPGGNHEREGIERRAE